MQCKRIDYKEPSFCQKSPLSYQKSPINCQKSHLYRKHIHAVPTNRLFAGLCNQNRVCCSVLQCVAVCEGCFGRMKVFYSRSERTHTRSAKTSSLCRTRKSNIKFFLIEYRAFSVEYRVECLGRTSGYSYRKEEKKIEKKTQMHALPKYRLYATLCKSNAHLI